MSRKQFYNTGPGVEVTSDIPSEVVRAEFARRLQKELNARGWKQTDLARRASEHSTDEIGRDLISNYVRGKSLPLPHTLDAISKALGVEMAKLLPARGVGNAGTVAPAFEIKDLGDGKMWVKVNQTVDWETAQTIMAALRK